MSILPAPPARSSSLNEPSVAAVDAATGAEIASVSYQGKAPSQVYGENRDDRFFDPDEKNLDTDAAFLAFLKKIDEYYRENP